MKIYAMILMTAILTQNFILARFLGICPFLGVSKKLNTAVGMSVAVTFVMVLATAATFPINSILLIPRDLEFLQNIVFILVIAGLVQLLEVLLKRFAVPLYNALGIYLPLITTNCAIIGVALINIRNEYNFIESIVDSAGAGIGFTLAIVLLAGIREKYENNPSVPFLFRGFPLALFTAGLMSIAFMGFQGLI